MKPFGNPPAYSNFISETKAYLLLLFGGIALFAIICAMQLFFYFNSRETITPSANKASPIASTKINDIKSSAQPHYSAIKTVAANVTVSNKRRNPHRFQLTQLSKKESDFLKQNKKTTDSVIKYLGGITEMQELHFNKNSYHLKKQNGLKKLDSIVQQCLNAPETWSRMVILGFTDNRGSQYNNIKLGLKRALYLKNKLVSKGIPASKITIASFGEELAIGNNNTETGRHSNRRVEFNLIGNS